MMSSLSNVSEMLERNLELFAGKRLLVCGLLEDDLPLLLRPHVATMTLFTTDYSYYRRYRPLLGEGILFGHRLPDDASYDALLLLLPKAKQEGQYLMAMAAPLLTPGADLLIAGDNKGGINGADKLLAPYGEKPLKRDSARRASLYHSELSKPVSPFDIEQWVGRYRCELEGRALEIHALPGVFSAAELDNGSRLLLQHLPPLSGRVLDFGCGAGVLGCAMGLSHPGIELELVDINALALESSRRTLAANGVVARVYPSDVYSDIQGSYAHLISNPPFHAGLKTFYAATETFLADARSYLQPGGALTIVANAFLRYQPILQQGFRHTDTVADDRRFRIYHCHQ
ncbi:16S rRNA (guanine(1207)-N(2))-methyltransferase RsmC [Aeromonas schubertii]|uniref:16S rRNA (guanine(1207)-N(2))-methyltransferase RsmC n=1 Tax=Aeromonas schubertii TaxID=652 RepID=UPI0014594517|nr:16S rRNA (guanine(1207)-N(2))-methyltransferase RsmC [Aeromonas schubertii]